MSAGTTGISAAEIEVGEALTAIKSAYAGWHDAEARTNEACHKVLAEIFVHAPSIDDDIAKKTALVAEVRKHPDVGMSNRYDPFKRSSADVMLTLLFGLKEHRNTKSHWRTVLQAAEEAIAQRKLTRTREEFVAWISSTTIQGARKSVATPRSKFDPATLEQFIGDKTIELPFGVPNELEAPSGFALIIVKLGDAVGTGVATASYVGCVASPTLLESARKALLRQHSKDEAAFEEQCLQDMGDPSLLIPKAERSARGATHYGDEDERDDALAEKRYLARETRRRLRERKMPKSQWELAKGRKGQSMLPNVEGSETSLATELAPVPVAEQEEDEIDYFAKLVERPEY